MMIAVSCICYFRLMGCWMIKIIRYGLLMVCLLFAAQKMFVVAQHESSDPKQLSAEIIVSEAKKQCRNLICLFDVRNDEQLFGNNSFVGVHLMNALREKVAPIIVTTDNLRHFCYWKTHLMEVVKNFSFNHLRYFLSNIIMTQLTDKDWYCYAHKKTKLMLLIPKNYVAINASGQKNDIHTQMKHCGFDVSNLDKISNVSPVTILKYIDSHQRTYNNIINAFESMFIKHRDQLINSLLWNIYVAGHGEIVSIDRRYTAESITQREDELRRAIALEDSSTREIEQYEDDLFYLKKLSDDLNKHGVIRSGYSAGLKFNDFLQLISFFAKNIQTSYLHYSTCFSGGFNQALLNQELSQINAQFIVSAKGINESEAYGQPSKVFGSSVFTNFFTAVGQFFCNPIEFVAQQKVRKKDPIAEIVSTVVNKHLMDFDQPFVRIPNVGVFNAFSVDKQVKILTNAMVRAHELEGAPIDCTDPEIKTILVYPSYIGSPLEINEGVAIVSPAPQVAAQKETIHVFEKVIYNDQLYAIIANFVSFNARYEPIIFVIKELHCLDYAHSGLEVGDKKPIVIKDMVIYIKGFGSNYLDVAIDVVFSFNNVNYSCMEEINNLQGSNELFKKFKAMSFSSIAQPRFDRLAEVLIGRTAMKSFEKNEISLPRIIEYFENKVVKKSVRVEKPGSLKNVLLLKRLDSLERSITQEALSEQKAWIKSKNKSVALSLVRNLDRYKQEAEKLIDEIDALPQVRSGQLHDDLKTRIMNAYTIINKESKLAASQLSWLEYFAMHAPSPRDMVKKVGTKASKIIAPMSSRISRITESPKHLKSR